MKRVILLVVGLTLLSATGCCKRMCCSAPSCSPCSPCGPGGGGAYPSGYLSDPYGGGYSQAIMPATTTTTLAPTPYQATTSAPVPTTAYYPMMTVTAAAEPIPTY